MRHLKVFLAFALGWAAVTALGLVFDVVAQRGKGGAQTSSLQSRINALQDRVKKMEQAAAFGKLPKKVLAPFEVVDRAGNRIFYVSPERDVEFYRDGKRVSLMSAGGDVGTFWAFASAPDLWATLTGDRLAIHEKGQTRMELGRSMDKGNYRLKFYSSGGKDIAGIGESPDTQAGLVNILDKAGQLKAQIGVSENKGIIDVLGANQQLIAALTELRGGYLVICGANGCSPPMVEAGDLGGYGVVRTGPSGYNPGVGLLGVPGSFVEGKHQ